MNNYIKKREKEILRLLDVSIHAVHAPYSVCKLQLKNGFIYDDCCVMSHFVTLGVGVVVD